MLAANSNKIVEPEVNYVRPESINSGFQEFQKNIEGKMADLMTLQTNLINILSSNAKKEEQPKVEPVQQPTTPITPQAALAPEESEDIKLGWFSKLAIAAGIVYVGKSVLDLYTENTELKCSIKN